MAQLLKIKAQMSSIWAKGCMLIVCVCYLTRHDNPSLVEGESHGILLFDSSLGARGFRRFFLVGALRSHF